MTLTQDRKAELLAAAPLFEGVDAEGLASIGRRIVEVDRSGKIVKEVPLVVKKPDPHHDTRMVRKLENGHYLVCHENDGCVREYDAGGKVVWEYRDPYLSHCFAPLANGNVLVAKWRKVPDDIARRVKGGQPGTERKGEMYGEAIQEIDRNGRVVWEWLTFEHLDPERDAIGPLHPRDRSLCAAATLCPVGRLAERGLGSRATLYRRLRELRCALAAHGARAA